MRNPVDARDAMRGEMHFRDRRHAGQVVAERLKHYRGRHDVLVLALPRGGVPARSEDAEVHQLLAAAAAGQRTAAHR
jgi:hypothetical protein